MGITEETVDWARAVPVVLLFSCGMGLDWDFVVGSEYVSLGSFSGILFFLCGSCTSPVRDAFVALEPQVVTCSYLVHFKNFELLL